MRFLLESGVYIGPLLCHRLKEKTFGLLIQRPDKESRFHFLVCMSICISVFCLGYVRRLRSMPFDIGTAYPLFWFSGR